MSLTRNGVAVRGHENCHAKFMVVDDVTVPRPPGRAPSLIWTEVLRQLRLRARPGPGSGLEIGARLDGTAALSSLTRYLRHALANADHEFVRRPVQRQVNGAAIFGASRAWPLPAELRVRAAQED